MPTDLPTLLTILGAKETDVRILVRSGSRVYGCATEASDEDFVAVLSSAKKRDLLFRPNINIIVHTEASFQEALDEHNILALECQFCPPEHWMCWRKPFTFPFLSNPLLVATATEKSDSDFKKAEKQFAEEPEPSKKKLYHSIRVLLFAAQIAKSRCITNYGAANEIWEDIQTRGDAWSQFEDLVELRNMLKVDLEGSCSQVGKSQAR